MQPGPEAPFRVTERRNYTAIQLFDGLPPKVSPELVELFKSLGSVPRNVVVSCGGVSGIPKEWIDGFLMIDQQLRASNKRMCFVHVPPKLEGLERSSEVVPDLSTALMLFESGSAGFDKMHFVKAFVAATLRTVFVQASARCTQGKISVLPPNDGLKVNGGERLLGDVTGVIFVEAPGFCYVVMLSFPEKTYLGLMSRMFGERLETLTEELADGAAEFLNIIYGQSKVVLNRKSAGIKPEIPQVVRGKSFPRDRNPKLTRAAELVERGKIVVVPFDTEEGPFYVEVCFPDHFKAAMLRA